MRAIVEAFKALSDPTRVRIIGLLTEAPEGACVCELVDALRLPQYQVSRHLGVLRAAGLVDTRRKGTWVFYALVANLPEPLAQIVDAVGEAATDTAMVEDRQRLRQRLQLREDGVCVVGYDPVQPFRNIIPVRLVPAKEST
jgi:ArsR family transcriptional regulator, arsenate/arsenite/antimonite-responsive transcriptional repressor